MSVVFEVYSQKCPELEVLKGRRKPSVPREKDSIGGTYVDENKEAA
jgi:hypothetical protein